MEKQKKKSKGTNFLVQGSILAVTGIIVRLIGLIYRIPLTNTIGNEGIGVYNTAYSIYNIMLLISSYSLPLAVSRLVAGRISLRQYKNARRIFTGAFVFAAAVGGTICAVTYFGAEVFANMMGMESASYAIKTLAPTILVMAFLGVLRGYFQGHGTMIPTAFSQLIEQIFNAVVSVAAGYFLFAKGLTVDTAQGTVHYYSAAYGAAGGTIGTGIGALAALLFCIFVYLAYRRVERAQCRRDPHRSQESYQHITKVLLMTIVPVLVSTTIYQVSTIVDQGIYAQYLNGADAGYYKAIWGAYSGKYTVLIHVPTAIAASLSSSIIPSMAAAISRNNKTEIVDKTGTAIRFNMVIAFPATVGLAVLASPIMNLLFFKDNAAAITMMIIGSSAVLFNALSTITNSVLQGIGNIWIPVKNAIISLIVHVGILALLLWVFDLDIYAVVIANIFFYVFMCVLNNLSIRRILNYRQEWIKTFVCPLFSSAIMGLFTYLTYRLMHLLSGSNLLAVVFAIVVAVISYMILMLLTKGVDEVDLIHFPKGRKIISLARKLHLLN